MHRTTGFLLLTLLSCSSTPSTGTQHIQVEFLESIESLKLDYHGALSDEGLPERKPIDVIEARVREQITVQLHFFDVTEDASKRIWGDQPTWMRADRVERVATLEMMEALQRDGDARLGLSPRLLLPIGGTSSLSISRTFRYVDSFELHSVGDATIGDPKIGTGRDGLLVNVSASPGTAPDNRNIHITLDMAQLQRPIPQVESTLPGSNVSVQIQTPVYARQKFEVGAVLSAGEFLLLGPLPALDGDQPQLVLVSAAIATEPGTQAQPESPQ